MQIRFHGDTNSTVTVWASVVCLPKTEKNAAGEAKLLICKSNLSSVKSQNVRTVLCCFVRVHALSHLTMQTNACPDTKDSMTFFGALNALWVCIWLHPL